MGATSESISSSMNHPNPSSKVKVRKRITSPSFLIIFAIFLAVSSFRSSKGGPPSPGQSHQPQNHHDRLRRSHSGQYDATFHGPRLKNADTTFLQNHPVTEHDPNSRSSLRPSPHEENGEDTTENSHSRNTESSSVPNRHSETTTEPESEGASTESPEHHNVSTTKGPPEPCIKPAIEQFPRPWMGPNVRKHGGFMFYILATAYTFLALAIVCDEFFVPSLDLLCEMLKISPDVAGATFMAAGSSAPELATALIGVFIAKDDIGVSGVIGSAVFNIMFVISICALLTPTVLYLNWWPMVRDCFFYMISILALLGTIFDEKIEWYESIILLILYCVYIYVMYINEILEAWAHTLPISFPVHTVVEDENSHLVTYKQVPGGDARLATGTTVTTENQNQTMEGGYIQDPAMAAYGQQQADYSVGAASENNLVSSSVNTSGVTTTGVGAPTGMEPPKKVAPNTESILAQFDPPADSGLKKIFWRISLPLIYIFYYTVPDCRIETWKSWYIVTFVLSMVWIALFSYIMVWMITVIGFTVGIPDTVMGLTFVAAGVSVPDALSSLAVIKEGFGDMAVSNAVGSNVFDILVCLGLPWFLSTVIVHPGQPVQVISKGLTYSTFSLLSTVAFLLIATHYNGWKLDKKYGVMLMLWYIFFMVFASLYELNVFGDFNPPECDSEY